MRPLHRTETDETAALAMENDLLRLEVTHLRGRLAATEAELKRAHAASVKGGSGTRPVASGAGADDADARADLAWLLGRIEATPVSRVLRRREGYRRLVSTYLAEDDG